jgi:hypothetical protein
MGGIIKQDAGGKREVMELTLDARREKVFLWQTLSELV